MFNAAFIRGSFICGGKNANQRKRNWKLLILAESPPIVLELGNVDATDNLTHSEQEVIEATGNQHGQWHL